MDSQALKLKRKIMRRVYALFALRIARHPITLQAVLFVVAMEVFAKLVFVERVIDSFLNTSLRNIPAYIFNNIWNAFMGGEVLTLLALGVMIFVALSVPIQVWRLRPHKSAARAAI